MNAPNTETKGKQLNYMPSHWRGSKSGVETQNTLGLFHNSFTPECYEEVENAHPNIEAVFMPSNSRYYIQSLDQGIIKS